MLIPQKLGLGISTLVAILATGLYFTNAIIERQRSMREREGLVEQVELVLKQVERAKDELSKSVAEQAQVLQQIRANIKNSSHNRDILLLQGDISEIHSDLSALHNSLDTINNAIGTNPEKAMSIPLMRKDIEDLKTANQRDLDSLRGEMARSYDLNKWLIGLILAAVLGTTISSWAQSRKPGRPAPKRE